MDLKKHYKNKPIYDPLFRLTQTALLDPTKEPRDIARAGLGALFILKGLEVVGGLVDNNKMYLKMKRENNPIVWAYICDLPDEFLGEVPKPQTFDETHIIEANMSESGRIVQERL